MSNHKIIAPGVIGEDGSLRLSHRGEFQQQVRDSFKPGQQVLTSVEPYDDRLARMWAYYWAVVVRHGADYFGYTEEEMHAEWKRHFNAITYMDKRTGEEIRQGESTTRLSKKRQIEFVENCIRHLAEEGVNVPPPIKDNE